MALLGREISRPWRSAFRKTSLASRARRARSGIDMRFTFRVSCR